jgi:hypothetical protein
MIKHIGQNNAKKVVVLYRFVPNEEHMCLIAYSDLLPRMLHDEIMKNLESPIGQQADNLADSLFRQIMPDGRNVLEVLHREGFMKKVPTAQVIMTPQVNSKIRLDELNNILAEMAKGEDATKRLQEMDNNLGMQAKKKPQSREVGEPAKSKAVVIPPLQAGLNDALTDEAIASQQLAQAAKMRAEANGLLAEATRLENESAKLAPSVVKTKVESKKVTAKATSVKTETLVESDLVTKRKPGRPPKANNNDNTKAIKTKETSKG